jgi:hypothetical protein
VALACSQWRADPRIQNEEDDVRIDIQHFLPFNTDIFRRLAANPLPWGPLVSDNVPATNIQNKGVVLQQDTSLEFRSVCVE